MAKGLKLVKKTSEVSVKNKLFLLEAFLIFTFLLYLNNLEKAHLTSPSSYNLQFKQP